MEYTQFEWRRHCIIIPIFTNANTIKAAKLSANCKDSPELPNVVLYLLIQPRPLGILKWQVHPHSPTPLDLDALFVDDVASTMSRTRASQLWNLQTCDVKWLMIKRLNGPIHVKLPKSTHERVQNIPCLEYKLRTSFLNFFYDLIHEVIRKPIHNRQPKTLKTKFPKPSMSYSLINSVYYMDIIDM